MSSLQPSGNSGDFIRLVTAIQNRGCRVEVIGFNNVSAALRETADFFISGFLVPGLLPIQSDQDIRDCYRGMVIRYKPDRGFGFMRYYRLCDQGLINESLFFSLFPITI